ncbi:MAG: peptidylprolyl isomerase [Bacteroidales bacterium]|nr:peptidylprolyl isomerase [Bacteroidales bacterium]
MLTAQEEQVKIVISTSYGDITAVLYNETPQHRDNFVKLVKEGWYEGSPFHRIIQQFMIQGGQNADGRMDPDYRIPAEIKDGLYHKKGALAAARMGDQVNPKKESSGSQFYIVQGKKYTKSDLTLLEGRSYNKFTEEQIKDYTTIGGTPFLDWNYTVFGEVTDGLEIIDKIGAVKTGKGDKPVNNVTMSIKIIE